MARGPAAELVEIPWLLGGLAGRPELPRLAGYLRLRAVGEVSDLARQDQGALRLRPLTKGHHLLRNGACIAN